MNTMITLASFLSVLLAGILFYYYQKQRPDQFTGDNIQKSLSTLGVLALCLMALIWFMITLMRSG